MENPDVKGPCAAEMTEKKAQVLTVLSGGMIIERRDKAGEEEQKVVGKIG